MQVPARTFMEVLHPNQMVTMWFWKMTNPMIVFPNRFALFDRTRIIYKRQADLC